MQDRERDARVRIQDDYSGIELAGGASDGSKVVEFIHALIRGKPTALRPIDD